MIRVGILDDHLLIIKGIEELIEDIENCLFTGGYRSIREAREALGNDQPDVLLLDINLPDGNGAEYCIELKRLYPDMKILALSSFDQSGYIRAVMRNGASGYLLKNTGPEELQLALEAVMAGNIFLQDEIKQKILDRSLGLTSTSEIIEPPTPREREVLQLIAEGYTSQKIAERLFISLKTVETHRSNLISKFQAGNMAELIHTAMASGMLD